MTRTHILATLLFLTPACTGDDIRTTIGERLTDLWPETTSRGSLSDSDPDTDPSTSSGSTSDGETTGSFGNACGLIHTFRPNGPGDSQDHAKDRWVAVSFLGCDGPPQEGKAWTLTITDDQQTSWVASIPDSLSECVAVDFAFAGDIGPAGLLEGPWSLTLRDPEGTLSDEALAPPIPADSGLMYRHLSQFQPFDELLPHIPGCFGL